ncbi:hypothetical protein K7432_001675 [Basidiobolus ranarum]|uniref:Zn(2)-C6 fungal-type domain-containing protein n=1 Tax=Basidiobolus ranarum TaxID=34480 RepID=A0ABR2W925_9FUNG
MEREQSQYFLNSRAVPFSASEVPTRELSWPSNGQSKRQREFSSGIDDKLRKTKKPSSDESSNSEPIKRLSSKKVNKTHVPSACANCKKAHLACDVSRPCKRCLAMGKTDTCIDIQHKKRGRPKIKDRKSDSYLLESNYSQIISLTPTTTFINQAEPQSTSMLSPATSISQDNASRAFNRSISHVETPELNMPAPVSNYPSSTHNSSTQGPPPSSQSSTNLSSHHTSHFQNTENVDPASSLHFNLYDPSKSVDPNAQDDSYTHSSNDHDFIMMLNFKMDCAMISEEYHDLLGYTSQDLVHRSFYDIVHTTDIDRIRNLKDQLIDHVVQVVTQYQGSFLAAPLREGFGCSLTIEDIQKQTYSKLNNPASGSEECTEAIHIRRRDGGYELFNVHMKVGGAFGTDLTSIDTYDKAYLICKLAKFQLPSLTNNSYGNNTL